MSRMSDSVRDAELVTKVQEGTDVTCHLHQELSLDSHQRTAVRKEYWKRRKMIAFGGFGSVWLEQCVKGEKGLKIRAVKEIKKDTTQIEIDYRELEAITRFSHPRYVQTGLFVESFGWWQTDEATFIAMEYFQLGDLYGFISRNALSEIEAQSIVSQLLEALILLHEKGFVHRDLKPGNILVQKDKPWRVKIGDFGLSKRAEEARLATTKPRHTEGYTPPEFHGHINPLPDDHQNACARDLWALGVITYQILTRQIVFPDDKTVLGQYTRGEVALPIEPLQRAEVSGLGVEFIQRLLHPDPRRRLTAKQASEHPWIAFIEERSNRRDSVTSIDFPDFENTTKANFTTTYKISAPSGAFSTTFSSDEPTSINFSTLTQGTPGHNGPPLPSIQAMQQHGTAPQWNSSPNMHGFDARPGRYNNRMSESFGNTSNENQSPPNVSITDARQPPPLPSRQPADIQPRGFQNVRNQIYNSPGNAGLYPYEYPLEQGSASSTPIRKPVPQPIEVQGILTPQSNTPLQSLNSQERPQYGYNRPVSANHANFEDSAHVDNHTRPQGIAQSDATDLQSSARKAQSEAPSDPYMRKSAQRPASNVAPPVLPDRSVSTPEYVRRHGASILSGTSTTERSSTSSTFVDKTQDSLKKLSINFDEPSTTTSSPPISRTQPIQAKAMMANKAIESQDLAFEVGDIITVIKRTNNTSDYWSGYTEDARMGRFPGAKVWMMTPDLIDQQLQVPLLESIYKAPDSPDKLHFIKPENGLVKADIDTRFTVDLPQSEFYLNNLGSYDPDIADELTHFRYTVITTAPDDFLPNLRQMSFEAPRYTDVLISIHVTQWPALETFSKFLHTIFDEVSRLIDDNAYENIHGERAWRSVVVLIHYSSRLDEKEIAFFEALGIPIRFTGETEDGQPLRFVDAQEYRFGDLYRRGQNVQSIGRHPVHAQLYECTTQKYVEVSNVGGVAFTGNRTCPIQLMVLDSVDYNEDWMYSMKEALDARIQMNFTLSASSDSPVDIPRETILQGWALADKAIDDNLLEQPIPILSANVALETSGKRMDAFASKFGRVFGTSTKNTQLSLFERAQFPGYLTWRSMWAPYQQRMVWFWNQGYTGYLQEPEYIDAAWNFSILPDVSVRQQEKRLELTYPPEYDLKGKERSYCIYFQSSYECEQWAAYITSMRDLPLLTSNPGI